MITFEREYRTPHSEAYTIFEGVGIVGRIDLHFTGTDVLGTLCTTADADEARIKLLLEAIDERLVMTADKYRDDLIISVWRGSPAGTFSDADANTDEE
jgi:hypothetical protein